MMLARQALIQAKTEANEGSDAFGYVADSSKSILASNINVTFNPTLIKRDENLPTLSPTGEVLAQRYATVTFSTAVRNASGSPGVLPREDPLFRAVGLSPAISAGSSSVYTPNTGYCTASANVTASIYAYLGGIRHALLASRGNLEMVFDTTGYGRFNWTFQGFFRSLTDSPNVSDGIVDEVPSGTFENLTNILPQPCINNTVTINIGGAAPAQSKIMQTINLNMNNDVQPRPDIGGGGVQNNGIWGFIIRAREPAGTLNPEMCTRAAYDWFNKFFKQTQGTLAYQLGAVSGNIFKLDVASLSMRNVTWGDRNGVRIIDIPYLCNTPGSGDDEFKITLM